MQELRARDLQAKRRTATLRCPLCGLKSTVLHKHDKVVNWATLLLPCVNLNTTTRDHSKGCRGAISALEYYAHINDCTREGMIVNNPSGSLQPEVGLSVAQEVITVHSESEGEAEASLPRNI